MTKRKNNSPWFKTTRFGCDKKLLKKPNDLSPSTNGRGIAVEDCGIRSTRSLIEKGIIKGRRVA